MTKVTLIDCAKRLLDRAGLKDLVDKYIWENRFCFQALTCSINYRRQLKRVRAKPKNRKIRVLFIVSEIAKWKEQRLYEVMAESGDFEPMVGLSAWNRQREDQCSDEELLRIHDRAEAFFKRHGVTCVRTVVVQGGKRIVSNLAEFSPDIVYYTEPWGPCAGQDPVCVSRFALTLYSPYYVPNYGNLEQECHLPFHRHLFGYFCLSEYWSKLFDKSFRFQCHNVKFIPTGHPALDFFHERRELQRQNSVIYAPHFSFPHPKHRWLSQLYGTFDWNGFAILKYAKEHPELKWVFKPHPLLSEELERTGMMTKQEVESYYAEWAKLGIVCQDADYQELFLTSSAMITDCGSFLTEYGATGHPILHLICNKNIRIPLPPTKQVYDTYYQIHNLTEMKSTFRLILEEGKDPKRVDRLEAVKRAGFGGVDASKNIVRYLKNMLER